MRSGWKGVRARGYGARVFALPTLVIRPDSARVEAALVAGSRARGFVDAGTQRTFSQLLEALDAPGWAKLAPADPWLVRMMLAAEAGRAQATFGELALTADFAMQADALRGELFAQDVSPSLLADVGARVGGRTGEKVRALTELFDAVDARLAEGRLVDRRQVPHLAARRLKEAGLPEALLRFGALEVRELHDLPPARLGFLDALARACSSSGRGFRLVLPLAGSPSIDALVGAVARFFEKRWESLPGVELVPEAVVGERSLVLRQLFSAEPRPGPLDGVDVVSCASPREEAQAIAVGIKRRLERGVPPERVAVAFRDLAEDSELLVEALDAVGVPSRARLGLPLAQSPIGRLTLSVLELAEAHFPVAQVAALLESRYAPALSAALPPCRSIFAEAGVRDELIGQRDGQGGWLVRLGALLDRRAREAEARPSLSGEVKVLEVVIEAVRRVLALGRSIPPRGTALALLEAWWKALGSLGIEHALDAPSSVTHGSLGALEIDRAIARDQASFEALSGLVRSLRFAFERSGFGAKVLDRRSFHRWLSVAAGQVNLDARGARAGAVWLLDVRELLGTQFEAVFVGGLVDGRFPGRATPARLISDEERVEVNAAAATQLFRGSVLDDGVALPLRLAEDRFLFHAALVAAPVVTLSAPRTDARGRELLRSPFLDALERVAQALPTTVRPHRPVPLLDEVESAHQFAVRAALEVFSPVETRQSARDGRATALAEVIAAAPWASAARQISAIERERLRFFTAERGAPRAFSGGLEGGVLERLLPAVAWDAAHPVSASQLEAWSNCHFLGLSRRVLRLQKDETAGEELDHRAVGDLLHAALKRLIPELQQRGQWPPAKTQRDLVSQLLERALHAAVDEVSRSVPLGHHLLFEVSVERARRELLRLVFEPAIAPFIGSQPKAFEASFGRTDSPPPLQQVAIPPALDTERPIFLTGAIDRLDVAPGQALVVDYKLTRPGTPKARLDALLLEDFQLPLYLFVAKTLHPERKVDAAWVGLRRGEALVLSRVLRDEASSIDDLLAVDEPTRRRMAMEARPNLANAVHGLQASLRKGDFGARPMDCKFCQLKSVCRISARRLHEGPELD